MWVRARRDKRFKPQVTAASSTVNLSAEKLAPCAPAAKVITWWKFVL
jgi:hypothetical protein